MLNMYKQITIHTLKDQGEKNTTIARQLGGPCTHLPYQISPFQREPCLPAGRYSRTVLAESISNVTISNIQSYFTIS